MKRLSITHIGLLLGTITTTVTMVVLPVSALSATTTAAASTTASSAANKSRTQVVINRGNTEIARRLTTLNKLSAKITATTKLSAGDKSSLSSEVSGETSALTSLKTKLDADTDATAARNDAQSVITGYRVYALVVPKVYLVKTADDQQVTEAKLTTLAGKFQTRIASATKNVSTLQSELSDLSSKVSAAQGISSSIETGVIGLQPTDYNSDHSVLSGDRDKLKTAQTDIQTALTDAKQIVSGLKNAN